MKHCLAARVKGLRVGGRWGAVIVLGIACVGCAHRAPARRRSEEALLARAVERGPGRLRRVELARLDGAW